ncbi:hypothetical protein SLS63_012470 [Diaporthe eres]|uniref:Cell wall mannoprotein PIR1-like C-terminal domain-containing protein n=1 Tax=Diaporthe eres TaxID=83184 RepID=A0ABR1NR67_DIAER
MAIFKLFSIGLLSAAVITKVQANGTNDGCTFSLSASGGIECPAGQLDDGQIRLNGSYPTAEFTIRGDKIWDSAGRGCIVTPAPITQVQCDLNAEPAPGFSIDSSNKLLYQGSSEFYACPATDAEYNVYIKPDFGQTKCFAVTLTASGCGSAPPPPPPPPPTTSAPTCPSTQPPSTVTETTTCTVTQAVTVPGNASTVSVTGPVSTVSVSGVGSTTTETTTCTVTDTSTITSMGTHSNFILDNFNYVLPRMRGHRHWWAEPHRLELDVVVGVTHGHDYKWIVIFILDTMEVR